VKRFIAAMLLLLSVLRLRAERINQEIRILGALPMVTVSGLQWI